MVLQRRFYYFVPSGQLVSTNLTHCPSFDDSFFSHVIACFGSQQAAGFTWRCDCAGRAYSIGGAAAHASLCHLSLRPGLRRSGPVNDAGRVVALFARAPWVCQRSEGVRSAMATPGLCPPGNGHRTPLKEASLTNRRVADADILQCALTFYDLIAAAKLDWHYPVPPPPRISRSILLLDPAFLSFFCSR